MTRRTEADCGPGFSGVLDQSNMTSKGQLALPKTVRTAPGIGAGVTVRFIMQDNQVVVEPASKELTEDPAVLAFLDTLEARIPAASEFPVVMMEAVKALTADVEVDLGAPIVGDVVI